MKYLKMSLKDLIEEHEKLTKILKERKKSALTKEFKDQSRELKGYKKKLTIK